MVTESRVLRGLAEELRERLVEFSRRLIRTPSLPGHEGEVARLVAEEMRELGYDEVRTDEVGNVIGLIRGAGSGRSLMLNTHLDHVDSGDESRWPFPPFAAELHEGCIWGRGAVDIKGPTAAQVHGAAILKAAGVRPEGDVVVVVAVQEEVGGLGSVEVGRSTKTDRAVVGEPSGNELRRGHRGRVELLVGVRGRSCHASVPEKGINPHYSMSRFVTGLRDVRTEVDPFLGRESFAPTLIQSDQSSANVVPGELTLHVDWRTIPSRAPEEVRAELARLLEASLLDGASGQVDLRTFDLVTYTGARRRAPTAFPSFVLPEGDPLVSESRAALEEALGREVPVGRWEFATDGGHLTAAGVPTIGFGPGDPALAHTTQERIGVTELVEGAVGYAALALRLTSGA